MSKRQNIPVIILNWPKAVAYLLSYTFVALALFHCLKAYLTHIARRNFAAKGPELFSPMWMNLNILMHMKLFVFHYSPKHFQHFLHFSLIDIDLIVRSNKSRLQEESSQSTYPTIPLICEGC